MITIMENPIKVKSRTTIQFDTDLLNQDEWKQLFGYCAKTRTDLGNYFAQVMKRYLKEVKK